MSKNKNKHRYHPPTRQEYDQSERNLSKSDQRAIRTGIRAATGGVSGEVDMGKMALASLITTNLPDHARDLITVTRVTADRVLGSDIHTRILLDLFGGDMVREAKAMKEYQEVEWYLDEVYDADRVQRGNMGELMLKNLSPDAKSIVKKLVEICFEGRRAAYVMDLIDSDNLSSQPDDGRQ